MQPMFIETETTPNPATLKFLPGEIVMASGTREFTNDGEAEASPLAQALFSLGDVTGVFLGRDFISVTAGEGAAWSALKPQVVAVLLDHLKSRGLQTSGEGAFYLWVHVPKGETSDTYAAKLAERNILVVPGNQFGREGEGFIRLAMVPTLADCKAAAALWP